MKLIIKKLEIILNINKQYLAKLYNKKPKFVKKI